MRLFTHSCTATSGLIATNFLFGSPELTPEQFGVAVVSSALIDMDNPKSHIRKVLRLFLPLDLDFLEHRGTCHSVFLGILIALVSFRFLPDFWVSISVGFFSHLFGDLFQNPGIKLVGFLYLRSRYTIPIGSRKEYLFLLILGLLPLSFYLLIVQPAGGFKILVLEQIGNLRAASELMQEDSDCRYFLRIQEPRLVVNGDFPFVHPHMNFPETLPADSDSILAEQCTTGVFEVIARLDKRLILRSAENNEPFSVWDNSRYELMSHGKVKVVKKEPTKTFSRGVLFENTTLADLFSVLEGAVSSCKPCSYFINGSIVLRKAVLLTAPACRFQTISALADGRILRLDYFHLNDAEDYFDCSGGLGVNPSLMWVERASLFVTLRMPIGKGSDALVSSAFVGLVQDCVRFDDAGIPIISSVSPPKSSDCPPSFVPSRNPASSASSTASPIDSSPASKPASVPAPSPPDSIASKPSSSPAPAPAFSPSASTPSSRASSSKGLSQRANTAPLSPIVFEFKLCVNPDCLSALLRFDKRYIQAGQVLAQSHQDALRLAKTRRLLLSLNHEATSAQIVRRALYNEHWELMDRVERDVVKFKSQLKALKTRKKAILSALQGRGNCPRTGLSNQVPAINETGCSRATSMARTRTPAGTGAGTGPESKAKVAGFGSGKGNESFRVDKKANHGVDAGTSRDADKGKVASEGKDKGRCEDACQSKIARGIHDAVPNAGNNAGNKAVAISGPDSASSAASRASSRAIRCAVSKRGLNIPRTYLLDLFISKVMEDMLKADSTKKSILADFRESIDKIQLRKSAVKERIIELESKILWLERTSSISFPVNGVLRIFRASSSEGGVFVEGFVQTR